MVDFSLLRCLKYIDLNPLVTYRELESDRLFSRKPLCSIDDSEPLTVDLVNKLKEHNIFYWHDLTGHSLHELARKARLSDSDQTLILRACCLRGTSLLTEQQVLYREEIKERQDEKLSFKAAKSFQDELSELTVQSRAGSAYASLVLGKLARAGMTGADEASLYLRAKALGSVQACNDYGVIRHLKTYHVNGSYHEIRGLFADAAEHEIPEALVNLALANLDFTTPSDSDVQNADQLILRARNLGMELPAAFLDNLFGLARIFRQNRGIDP